MTKPRNIASWVPALVGPIDIQSEVSRLAVRRPVWKMKGVTITDVPDHTDDEGNVVGRTDFEFDTASVNVQDDIAKSDVEAATVDRVRGANGIPFKSATGGVVDDGAAPPTGGAWTKFPTDEFRPDHPTMRSFYDVRHYGAKGDGTTDDTAAINAAIAAANATGGVVHMPAGTYKVTAPLTTLDEAVCLRGVGDTGNTSNTGTLVRSYISGPTSLLSVGDFGGGGGLVNWYTRNGVEGISFEQMVDTFASYEIEGSFAPSEFYPGAFAAIEATGATNFAIRNVSIRGFPIGIVLDGAENAIVERCTISSGDDGYSGWEAHGIGIWLTSGPTRARGNDLLDATNANVIRDCQFYGGAANIWVEAGIQNAILTCGFNRGVDGVLVGGPINLSIRDVYFEAGGYSNALVHRQGAGTCQALGIKNAEMITSTATPILVENALYGLSVEDSMLGSESGSYCITSASYIVGFSLTNCLMTQSSGLGVLGLCNGSGGVGINAPITNGYNGDSEGVGINSLTVPGAALDITRLSAYGSTARNLIRVRDTTPYDSYRLAQINKQHMLEEHVLRSTITVSEAGPKRVSEWAALAGGASAQTLCKITIPDYCLAEVTFTCIQWTNNASTTRRCVKKFQRAFRDASAGVTFLGALADEHTPEDTSAGALAAPTLVAVGNAVGVQVTPHASDDGRVLVVADVYLVTK